MASFRTKKPYGRPESRPQGSDGEWLHDMAPTAPRALRNRANNNAQPSGPPSSKLQVSNLHYEVTPKDLSQIFGKLGTLVREPAIRYDRSGRSSGIAVITYETMGEATKAKSQFNDKLCKGQPMKIEYLNEPPERPARRSASTPTLLNRIQKPSLMERLSQEEPSKGAPAASQTGVGPIRNKPRSQPRSQPRNQPARPRAPAKSNKPKTAEELDKELDTFMAPPATGDVEMAS